MPKQLYDVYAKPRVTYRQEDGDDGYCYCVRLNGRAVSFASLTRREAMALKAEILADFENGRASKW